MSFPVQEKYEIPADFDGVFRFTNPSDEDFYGVWNKVQHFFPAKKTVPMIIPNETLESVQAIRIKFARELAEREFHKSDRFKNMEKLTPAGSGLVPAPYPEIELKSYADSCLIPLEEARPVMTKLPDNSTAPFHTDVTQVIDHKDNENRRSLAEGKEITG